MEAESKKFKVGDKVISVKDTIDTEEGFIGFINREAKSPFDWIVNSNSGIEKAFCEHELELLSVAKEVELPVKETIYSSALDKQVSGNHYKDCGIQPIEYIHANNLSYLEGNVIKYTTRHSKKNGKQDILKAIHYLELILEMEYKGETN